MRPAAEAEIAVQRCQHGVDGGWGVVARKQALLPFADAVFIY